MSQELEELWQRAALPPRVHELLALPEQPAPEIQADLAAKVAAMRESYEGLRDFENAIAMLNRAVQLNPDDQPG